MLDIICIPILILSILKNVEILPGNIAGLIIAFIILIGLIYVGRQIIDMSNRDNMNYDEYDWHFNKSEAPSNGTPSSTTDPWETPSLVCIGEQCCNDTSTYNAEQNLCIPN